MFAAEAGYEALQAFATSIGIGLLIGLERERQSDLKAGLRTFAVAWGRIVEGIRTSTRELERAIKSIGPINLTAIEECAQIEGRHVFLVRQRDDLKGALDSLRRAIQRINRASNGAVSVVFTDVSLYRFTGIETEKVVVRVQTDGDAPLELEVDGIYARLRVLPLFLLRWSVAVGVKLGTGWIDGVVARDGTGLSGTIEIDAVDGGQLQGGGALQNPIVRPSDLAREL